MVDKEYYNDMLLESDEYLELVEKYNIQFGYFKKTF